MENINKLKLAIIVIAFALIVSGLLELIFKFESDSIWASFIVGGLVGVGIVYLLNLVKKGRFKWLEK